MVRHKKIRCDTYDLVGESDRTTLEISSKYFSQTNAESTWGFSNMHFPCMHIGYLCSQVVNKNFD